MSRDRSTSTPEEDESNDLRDRSASTLFGRGMMAGFGWSPLYGREEADEPNEEAAMAADEEGDGSWWDEGLISLLIIAGVVLFFFPEPATSMLGVVLLLVGAVAWLFDAIM